MKVQTTEQRTRPSAFVRRASWGARLTVGIVFLLNVQCAVSFLLFPENFTARFELSGTAGQAAIQGIAVAFLMWNATYPLVIIDPCRYRTLFGVVLVQQGIGIVGESWIYLNVYADHSMLASSIARFVLFDAIGLIIMTIAFIVLNVARKSEH